MNRVQNLSLFDLTPLEMKLKILYCSDEDIDQKQTDLKKSGNFSHISPNVLTQLPFQDQTFDIALCYKVLFFDEDPTSVSKNNSNENLKENPKDNKNQEFHLKALEELARVASEVRIFPLVDSQGVPSKLLGPMLQALQQKGFGVEVKQIKQDHTSTAILRLWNESCTVEAIKNE